jgi:phosphonate transport system substrate-binding protein
VKAERLGIVALRVSAGTGRFRSIPALTRRATWQSGRALFFAALAVLFAGCAREVPPPAPDARPTVLRLGYTPSEEAVVDREAANLALARYLERALGGVAVTLVRTASYGPAVAAMARGEIDLVALAPFAFLLAADDGIAEAVAATGTAAAGPRTYRSALIAHRRTGLTNLDALAGRARALRFNYTDPASNSGHLVPQARLAALGLIPERDFAATEYTLSHSVAVLNVVFGRADVAGVNHSTLQRLIAKDRVRSEEIETLWLSEPLPNGPMAVRRALPAGFKREVQTALVRFAAVDPAASRTAMAQFAVEDLVFLACDDSLYSGLRALASQVARK